MLLQIALLVILQLVTFLVYYDLITRANHLQYCNLNYTYSVQQTINSKLYMRYIYFLLFSYCITATLASCQKKDLFSGTEEIIQELHTVSESEGGSGNLLLVTPEETKTLIHNPGKGFVQYWEFDPNYQQMYNTGYVRYDWSDIEPKKGVYNWNLIDAEISRYKEAGKKFAFGVMCANTNRDGNTPDKGKYVTPEWVFKKGAKGRKIVATYWETGVTKEQIIPVWTDAIFLAEVKNFIKAMGIRYNGNPNVAFIDVRSYGNWGEQHLYEIGGVDITTNQLIEDHLKPYLAAFPNTQIITPWGAHEYHSAYEWCVNNGIGMRSDGMFKYSNGSEVAMAHKKVPSVFEYVNSYQWLIDEGIWTKTALAEYVEIGKPSYIQFNAAMYEANKEMIVAVGNRMGYHFVLESAGVPLEINNGITYNIETQFRNKGVTNIYKDCHVAIALMDDKDNVVAKSFLNNCEPRKWDSDTSTKNINEVVFSNVKSGTYKLVIGLFENKVDAQPTYQLGNTNKIYNNWYVLNSSAIVN